MFVTKEKYEAAIETAKTDVRKEFEGKIEDQQQNVELLENLRNEFDVEEDEKDFDLLQSVKDLKSENTSVSEKNTSLESEAKEKDSKIESLETEIAGIPGRKLPIQKGKGDGGEGAGADEESKSFNEAYESAKELA